MFLKMGIIIIELIYSDEYPLSGCFLKMWIIIIVLIYSDEYPLAGCFGHNIKDVS